jgi:hypothetical protein
MAAGKQFTNPMCPDAALPKSLLVGNGMSPVVVSWHGAVNDQREMTRIKIRGAECVAGLTKTFACSFTFRSFE